MSRTILFKMSAFTLADLWLKARMVDCGLNEMIVLEFQKEIKKKTKSESIIPKIIISQRIAETIVKADLSEYMATPKEIASNYIKIEC